MPSLQTIPRKSSPQELATEESVLAALARTRLEARRIRSSCEPDSGVFRLLAGLGLILDRVQSGKAVKFLDLIRWRDTLADAEQEADK